MAHQPLLHSNVLFVNVCRKAKELRATRDVPFFANPSFFPSPPKSFQLPFYAEAIAQGFVTHDPKPTDRAFSVHPRILDFIDDSAMESHSLGSDSDDSSS